MYEFCLMQILLTAATKAEIGLLNNLPASVEIAITGVGCPSSIYNLQKKLSEKKYELVIQAGITGSFNSNLNQGQAVLVKQDTFADLGMEEANEFTSIFQTAFADKDQFPFTDGWLINEHEFLKNYHLQIVKAVTVNKVSDSKIQKQQLIKAFSPDIETMEGAALHYVCLQENIPFLQIRSISNEVAVRDKSKWNIKDAVINLNAAVEKIIQELQ